MKVEVSQRVLTKALAIVGRAVASRPTLPVLSHILLYASKDVAGSGLLMAATDLEVLITCQMSCKVDDPGGITMPARLFTDLVNALPGGAWVALGSNDAQLHITCASQEADVNGIDADEFPKLPEDTQTTITEISPLALAEALSQVVFAAATDESRPVLTGVLFVFDGDTLTMTAADGFRLSVRTIKVEGKRWQPVKVLVPARALNELVKLLADESEPITIGTLGVNDVRQILFHLPGGGSAINDVRLFSQLIEGNYVNYHQIIPPEESRRTRTIVDRAALIASCKAAALFAQSEANVIYLTADQSEAGEGRIKVYASSAEMGDYEDVLAAEVTGEQIIIAFNVRYFLEALNAMKTRYVALDTSSSGRPGVLRPVIDGKPDKQIVSDFVHVIMPMHIRQGETKK